MAFKSILKEVTLCLFSGKELSQAHCFAKKFALSYNYTGSSLSTKASLILPLLL